MSEQDDVRPDGDKLSEPLTDPRAPWEELIEDPNAPRKLLAVLFTDIQASTEIASAVGDKRWREILEQHDAAIRAQIARFGGKEIDTAGDAFFATFELPVRAVDCALEAMRAVRRLGLRIRAGVHMGECTVLADHVRGVTVHIGARVAAKARGDELLVSSTVRDILAGAGLKFLDRGEQSLKGIEGRWRLFAVEPRERDNAADLPPLLEREVAKPPTPWWRRRRVIVAAATALAVLIGAVGYVVLSGPGGLSHVPADSVASIDAASGDVESFVGVSRRPVGLAVARDGVWVANSIDHTVTRVGSATQTDTVTVGAGPIALAAAGDTVYVANADGATISRVSGRLKSQFGSPIRTGNGLSSVGFGNGQLWIANATDGTVWRIDPVSGEKKVEIAVGPALRGLAVTHDAVWVTSETAGTVTQINPRDGTIPRVIEVGDGPVAVATANDVVWVANRLEGTASRIDIRSGRVTLTTRVGRGPRAIAVAGGHAFVANEQDETVSMLDARSGRLLRTIALGNAPMDLAADGDTVWVSVRGGVLNYRGGTLRIGSSVPAPTVDPRYWDDLSTTQLAVISSVYDGLTSFKKVGGPEGNQLVPNLAEDIRPPTDNGTTYTFTLRAGLVYSDGTPVRASDVRATFERLLMGERYGAGFLNVMQGADECSPTACDLSAGVVTDDRARTIIFHLRYPYADFPYNLALPALSIVSARTSKADAGFTPIPGTGPYRMTKVETARDRFGNTVVGRVLLERNSRFRARELAQPDGYPDRIDVAFNQDSNELVTGVRRNAIDLMMDPQDVGPQVNQLVTELPAQVHLIDMPWNLFVVLNPNVPPFNNLKARQAVNYALDRVAMTKSPTGLFLGDISCQLLPKNVTGYKPYCPYTRSPNETGLWYGPDLAKARQLVRESGTAGQTVTVWREEGQGFSADERRARSSVVAEMLERIGYNARIEVIPGDYFGALLDPKSRHQVSLSGWASDYPGAVNFFLPLTACPQTLTELAGDALFSANSAHYCSPSTDAMVRRALEAQLGDPAAARDEWAKIDRAITDAAIFAPYANLRLAIPSSRRAGNIQGHGTYQLLITQVWVVEGS